MFRHDTERSGAAPSSHIGPVIEELWRIPEFNVTKYGAVKGSPAVVDDMLYCGTDTGRFLAVRADTGKLVWQVQIQQTTHGIHGSPAVVGSLVYIGAYDGTLYAFERMSGLLKWQHKLGYQIGSSPLAVAEWGLLFTANEEASGGGHILGLDARTGQELWEHRTDAHPHSSVAADARRGLLFVGDNRGVVHALNGRTGVEAWSIELDREDGKPDIKTTPMVIPERDLLVFGAWTGKVYALSEESGARLWQHQAGGRLMGSTAYSAARGMIYVGSPLGQLHALRVTDGALIWTAALPARIYSSPAVSGDGEAVVFGATDGQLYALRGDNGAELWHYNIGGQVTGSPALTADRIYVTSQHGGLVALRTRD